MADTRIPELWIRLERWLESSAPPLLRRLNAGATEERIQFIQSELGIDLGPAVNAFYSRHDGETCLDGSDFGFHGAFFSLDRVLQEHQSLAEAALDNDENGFMVSGPIKDCLFHLLWFPLFGSDGDYVCLDFAPAAGGTRGQLIEVTHEGERNLLASSLESWFESHVKRFESGQISYDSISESLEGDDS